MDNNVIKDEIDIEIGANDIKELVSSMEDITKGDISQMYQTTAERIENQRNKGKEEENTNEKE